MRMLGGGGVLGLGPGFVGRERLDGCMHPGCRDQAHARLATFLSTDDANEKSSTSDEAGRQLS